MLHMSNWISTDERWPNDGELVLAHWPAEHGHDALTSVVEYRYRKAKQELNSHLWTDPEDRSDDYSIPGWWMPLPDAPTEVSP